MAWTVDLLTPLNNASGVALLPTLTWDKVDGGGAAAPWLRVNLGEVGDSRYQESDGSYSTIIRADNTAVDSYYVDGTAQGGTVKVINNKAWAEQPGTEGQGAIVLQNVLNHCAQSWYSSDMYVEMTGFDTGKTYNIYIYGNRNTGTVDFNFYVNGDTANKVRYIPVTSQVTQLSDMPHILGVSPDGTGKITLNTELLNGYAILAGIWVEEVSGGAEPASTIRISKTDPTLQASLDVDVQEATAETYTVQAANELSENQLYYWGVSLDGGTTFDTVRQFTTLSNNPLVAPTLSGPADEATGVDFRPTLTWSKNDAATLFDLEYSVNSDFSGTLGVDRWVVDNINTESYTFPSDLANNTTFYWRVRSTDNTQYDSEYSTARSFTTKYGVPTAPTLNTPADGATGVSLTETLTWTDGGGADTYDLYVSTDSQFSAGALVTDIAAEQHTLTAGQINNALPYFWKVVAKNADGTAESEVRSFTSAAPNVPFAPSLESPINGDSDVYVRPTFTWIASAGATKYKLEVADNSGFNNAIVYNDQAGVSVTITEFLTPGTLYYWRVTAGNDNGYGSASGANTFTTQAVLSVNVPALTAPADDAINQLLAPTLEWTWVDNTGGSGTNYGALPDSSQRSIQSIVIDFASAPSYVNATKAPLKYDKEGAVTAAIDDGTKTTYSSFNSVQSNVYTDGCGNDIPFAYAIAHYSIAGNGKEVHEHPDYSSISITWAEIAEMLAGGCSIANHGFIDNNATGLLKLADAYAKWKTSKSQHFPSGLERGFDQKVYVGVSGVDVSAQALANGGYGCEAVNYGESALTGGTGTDLNQAIAEGFFANIYRRFEQGYSDSVDMINNQGAAERKWMNYGFHNGSALVSLMNTVGAAHGKAGTDKVWVPSLQELIEYIWVRENATPSVSINGTQATITIDTTGVPDDLMWYALSLNIQADANISNITINGGITEGVRKNSHNINYQSALINLQWYGNAYQARDVMADAQVDIAEATNNAENRDVALAYTNLVPAGAEKTALEGRITTLGDTPYVDSEDPGTIDEGSGVNYDPEDLDMKFDVHVAPASAPDTPVLNVTSINGSPYVYPGTLANNTEYVWKVKAHNEVAESEWTPVSSFTTIFGPPLQPTLVSPPDGAGDQDNQTRLTWEGGGEVDYWEFDISPNPDYSNPIESKTNYTFGSLFGLDETPIELNTTYYWRVRGVNSYGTGPYLEATFSTALPDPPNPPSYLTPASGSSGISRTPTFQWNTSYSAETYGIEVRIHNPGEADDNTLIESRTGLENTNHPLVSVLEYNKSYKWRVRGENVGGNGAWGTYWYFTTELEPAPGQTTLVAPSNGIGSIGSPITFQWDAIQFAEEYKLEISTDTGANFDASIIDTVSNIVGTQHVYSEVLSYSTQYFWRITASNVSGNGPASSEFNFTTEPIPVPGQVVLTTPTNHSEDTELTLDFIWEAQEHASSYELVLAKAADGFGSPVYTTELSGTSKQVSGLEYSVNYIWQVRAKNSTGNGAYSQYFDFTTKPLPAPGPVTNLQASWTGISLAISFDEATNAERYNIKVKRNGETVLDTEITETLLSTGDVYYETEHTIEVTAINATGSSDVASTTYTHIDAPLPQPSDLLTPANGSTGVGLNPQLTWAVSGGGTVAYKVQISEHLDFSVIHEETEVDAAEERIYDIVTPLKYSTPYYWRVASKILFNDGTLVKYSEYSSVDSFTTQDPPVPATPTISPSGDNISRKPTITWSDDADTDTFDLDIASDAGFTSILYSEDALEVTSFSIPANLDYGTTYYVRVRGNNTWNTGAWGEENFTTITLVVPSKVVITSPSDEDVNLDVDSLEFTWGVVQGADEYEYRLAIGTEDIENATIHKTTNLSVTYLSLEWYTAYKLQVRGINEVHTGEWSNAVTVTTRKPQLDAPVLDIPADNLQDAIISISQLSFRFNMDIYHGAETYVFELSSDNGFNNIINSATGSFGGAIGDNQVVNLQVDTSLLGFSSTYYWRVTSFNPFNSQTSTTRSFTTQEIPTPDVPVLSSPSIDAVNVPVDPLFRWATSQYGEEYLLEVFSDVDLTDVVVSRTVTEGEYQVPAGTLDFLRSYFWRVTARSTTYNTTSVSLVQRFTTIDVLVPGTPKLTYPYTASVVTIYDNIDWEPTENTDTYTLEVAKDETFIEVALRVEDLTEPTYELTTELDAGTYYARTKSHNDITDSTWSNHVKFDFTATIIAPPEEEPEQISFDLTDLAERGSVLASRIIYGLCDMDIYEECFEHLLLYEKGQRCSDPVTGTDTFAINVEGEGSWFFEHGYYRKPGNLVRFKIVAPVGEIIQKVIMSSSEGEVELVSNGGIFSFNMPYSDVDISIIYEESAPYALEWADRICISGAPVYTLKWEPSSRVCLIAQAAFQLRWSDKVCLIQTPEHGLEWTDRVCVAETSTWGLEWTDKVCVASTSKFKFELRWANRVCVAETPDYSLEWDDKICLVNKLLINK